MMDMPGKKVVLYYLLAVVLFLIGIASLVSLLYNVYIGAISTATSWTVIGIYTFYLFSTVPQLQIVGSWIARAFSFLRKGEIASVALAIEGQLNSIQGDLNKQSEGLMPFPAKVEWLERPNAESFCDTYDGKVIIRMKEHKHNPRNVAWATMDFVSKGMIPYSRLYLDASMSKAIDFTMVKKILSDNEGATDYFLREAVVPEMGSEEIKDSMSILENLDKRGIFTRIYLEEIKDLGLELYPNSDVTAVSETREFAENLNVYATRLPGEKSGEPYIRSNIKVGLVLIANPFKLEFEGPAPYMAWAGKCAVNGAKAIYILSRKEKNIPAAGLASKIADTFNFEIKKIDMFDEEVNDKRKEEALCIKLTPKPEKTRA
jgi:hypothetical protein